jgi:hypothetical protein
MSSTPNRTGREHLERFLPSEESLAWTGTPMLSRLFLRAVFRTAIMVLIASGGIYFAFHGITLIDLCGENSAKSCRKFYFWPWLGLLVAAIYTPLIWLGFLAHASGLLSEFYGLTEAQALRLRSNPFDKFQSVKFSQLSGKQIAVRKWFGTVAFGSVCFLCLSDADADAVRHAALNRARSEG